MMNENTYWNSKGLLQAEYDKQWEELVPGSGRCDSLQGEILRASSRLYHRYFNDGDRIEEHGYFPGSSAENAWGFLHKEGKKNLSVHWKMESIVNDVENLAQAKDDDEYEELLEKLANDATEFAKSRPLVPNELDMCDNAYSEYCADMCDLSEEEDEWEEDEWEEYDDDEEEDEE